MLYASVDVSIAGFWKSFASYEKVCSKLVDGKCPLTKGGHYTYRGTSTVPRKVPTGLKTHVRLRATDDVKGTLACVQIHVVVTK